MFLSVNLTPEALLDTTLHELFHVHDMATGRHWNAVEWELRAIDFAARMAGKEEA